MRTHSLYAKRLTALALALVCLVTASVTRVAAALTPTLTPQQIEAVIEDAFAGLVSFDVTSPFVASESPRVRARTG